MSQWRLSTGYAYPPLQNPTAEAVLAVSLYADCSRALTCDTSFATFALTPVPPAPLAVVAPAAVVLAAVESVVLELVLLTQLVSDGQAL